MSPAEQRSRQEARSGLSVATQLRLLNDDADQAERDRAEDAKWKSMMTKLVITFLISAILALMAGALNLLYQISIAKQAVKP